MGGVRPSPLSRQTTKTITVRVTMRVRIIDLLYYQSFLFNMAGGCMPNLNAFFTKCFTTLHPTAILRFLLQLSYKSTGNFSTILRNTSVNFYWYSCADFTLNTSSRASSFSCVNFINVCSCFYLYSLIYSFIYRQRAWSTATYSTNLSFAYLRVI